MCVASKQAQGQGKGMCLFNEDERKVGAAVEREATLPPASNRGAEGAAPPQLPSVLLLGTATAAAALAGGWRRLLAALVLLWLLLLR